VVGVPKYVVISTLTDEGAKTLKSKPSRVKEVNQELENMGVKVLEQYAVLGSFDFLNIVEAPDEVTIARAMVELASRGTIRTQTMPIIPIDEFLERLG
jgi:uncharacterized protein with GYD domain